METYSLVIDKERLPPAANPFAAWCVIRLKLRSCSPSPFGPWFAHRRRAGTNSIARCSWRSVSRRPATRAHGLAGALDQTPVEARVQRARGCASIRSRRASFINPARHGSTVRKGRLLNSDEEFETIGRRQVT